MAKHHITNANLYRVLAAVMTELREAGEIGGGDEGNAHYLVRWDVRRRRYVYHIPDWFDNVAP